MELINKVLQAETRALQNGDVEAYVSTEDVDRVGDIIRTSGWELDNFRKSGAPVLFSHDYSLPPIGKAVEMEAQRKGLWTVTRFHEKTQLSRDLAILARERIMKAWSVGFNPLTRPEARKGAGGEFLGYIYSSQELLEYSLVAVPANPEAVSKAAHMARKGQIDKSTADILNAAANGGLGEVAAAFARRAMDFRIRGDEAEAGIEEVAAAFVERARNFSRRTRSASRRPGRVSPW